MGKTPFGPSIDSWVKDKTSLERRANRSYVDPSITPAKKISNARLQHNVNISDRKQENISLAIHCALYCGGLIITGFAKTIVFSIKESIQFYRDNKTIPQDYTKGRPGLSQDTKNVVFDRANGYCERCHHRYDLSLHIHHKNEDPWDNRLSNLIAVCPNCHDHFHRGH
jgi:hypothetical protein